MLKKELAKRNLPELFLAPNGTMISSKEEWEKVMRPYWREVILREEYGRIPPYVQPEITTTVNYVDFAGKAVWETVTFTFTYKGKTHAVPTQLIYPADGKKHAFFIYLNFRPEIPDRYLPVEELIDNGFGMFSVCYNDVTTDDNDFTNGFAGLFQEGERTGTDTGKIIYWSYMASRMMDYLLTRQLADEKVIGVAGHSRLGKTALLTAALDERFAFTCSNDSGCSGAAISRYAYEGAEKISNIVDRFPYWFCPNYFQYANNEDKMPFDQHCVLSLVAPRCAFIGGAIEDVWADNDNQFLNCYASSKAWELYGKGIVCEDRLPVAGDTFTDGAVGFHLRSGKHYHSRTDWLVYMDAVKKHFQL